MKKLNYGRFPISKQINFSNIITAKNAVIIDAWADMAEAIQNRDTFDPTLSLFKLLASSPKNILEYAQTTVVIEAWNPVMVNDQAWTLLAIHPIIYYESPAMKAYFSILRGVHKKRYLHSHQLQLQLPI